MLFVRDEIGVFEPVLEGLGDAAALAAALGKRTGRFFDQPVVGMVGAGGDFVNRGFHFMCLLLVRGAFPRACPCVDQIVGTPLLRYSRRVDDSPSFERRKM